MRGLSTSHPRSLRARKFFTAVFNVANAAVGSGILAFPYAYACAGYGMAIIITIFAVIINIFTLLIILRTARKHHVVNYQDVVCILFGDSARKVLVWMSIVFCLLVNISYTLVVSSMLEKFFDSWFGGILSNKYFLMSFFSLLVAPLSFVRSVDFLGPTSMLGVTAVLFTVGVLVYHGSNVSPDEGAPKSELTAFNLKLKAFQAIPLIMFSLMCHLTVTPACANLAEYWPSLHSEGRVRMKTLAALVVAVMLLCGILYTPAGLFGYFLFGDNVKSDVLDSFDAVTYFQPGHNGPFEIVKATVDVKIARVCMALTTGLGYPVMVYVARITIFDVVGESDYMSRKYVLITTAYLFSALGLSIFCQAVGLDLGFVMSIVGSTAGATIQLVFPALMLLHEKKLFLGYGLLVVSVLMVVLGLFVTIANVACDANSTKDGAFCKAMGMDGDT